MSAGESDPTRREVIIAGATRSAVSRPMERTGFGQRWSTPFQLWRLGGGLREVKDPSTRTGDQKFSTALIANLPALRRYAVALVSSVAQADELVLGCIERALRESAQLREIPRIAGSLRRILHNLYVDELTPAMPVAKRRMSANWLTNWNCVTFRPSSAAIHQTLPLSATRLFESRLPASSNGLFQAKKVEKSLEEPGAEWNPQRRVVPDRPRPHRASRLRPRCGARRSRAMSQLGVEHRDILLLISVEELNYREISAGGTAIQSFQPLQSAEVKYRGRAVALVVAETLEAAQEAAALIRVSYSEYASATVELNAPAGTSVKQAVATPFFKDFVAGDPEAAIAAAPVRFEQTYLTASQHQNPIELLSTVAQWQGDQLIVHEEHRQVPRCGPALIQATCKRRARRDIRGFYKSAAGRRSMIARRVPHS
jgi:DNA-directed RNA polymerase specialized sigma24 family protein